MKNYSTNELIEMADELYLAIANKRYNVNRMYGYDDNAIQSHYHGLLAIKTSVTNLIEVIDDQTAGLSNYGSP